MTRIRSAGPAIARGLVAALGLVCLLCCLALCVFMVGMAPGSLIVLAVRAGVPPAVAIPVVLVASLSLLALATLHSAGHTIGGAAARLWARVLRVMIERWPQRYLRGARATKAHQDDYGTLWRVAVPGDEPLVMVEVVNSTPEPDGSRRKHFLRVPPTVQTARGAVAWSFGYHSWRPGKYGPEVET